MACSSSLTAETTPPFVSDKTLCSMEVEERKHDCLSTPPKGTTTLFDDDAKVVVDSLSDESEPSHVILVTGGAGFIGAHTVRHFVTKYPTYKVVVLDKLSYCSSLKSVTDLQHEFGSDKVVFVRGDICDKALVTEVMDSHSVDSVVHCAAETHVDRSFEGATLFTRTNVIGTQTLLECARRRHELGAFYRFVHISTDEVYGESQLCDKLGKKESDSLAPTNPYAASKAAAEMYALAYQRSFDLPVLVTRGNNTYGSGQFPEKLIPKFVTLLERGRKVCIYGDGHNLRCYLHVSDMASAIDTVLHKGVVGEVYNVGSETELSNNRMAELLIKSVKGESDDWKQFAEYVKDRPQNDARYLIDSAKVKALGWTQRVPFAEGLTHTVHWYRTEAPKHWHAVDDALVSTPHSRKIDDETGGYLPLSASADIRTL